MKKNKTLGIICLVLAVCAILGGFVNGTFENMQGENAGVAVGFIGGAVALVVVGIINLVKGGKSE